MSYKIEFTGIKEYADKYNEQTLKRIEKRILGKIAAFAKKDTKQNLKGALKRRTGKLQKAIKYKSLRGNAYVLFTAKYGYYGIMHEKGTKERAPRRQKYLTFMIGGEWKKKKSIAGLKSVWFAKRAIDAISTGRHKTEIDAMMQKIFDEVDRKQNGL